MRVQDNGHISYGRWLGGFRIEGRGYRCCRGYREITEYRGMCTSIDINLNKDIDRSV